MGVEQHTYPTMNTPDLTINENPDQLRNLTNRGVGIKGQ